MTQDKQYEIDKRYLKMAFIWAENSYAIRLKVGCLVVKNNMIISDGYNGTPSGFPNMCEAYRDGAELRMADNIAELKEKAKQGYELVSTDYVLHAEANAITKLAKSNNSSLGATLYVTDMPCVNCARLIIQAGIERVVYCRDYRIRDGIEFLKKANIEIVHINENEL